MRAGVAFLLLSSVSLAGPTRVGTNVGEMHPNFKLPTVDGERVELLRFRGKKLLLVHFASW